MTCKAKTRLVIIAPWKVQLTFCFIGGLLLLIIIYLFTLQKGRLPFQNAAMYGHTEALKLLLKEPGIQVDSLMKVHSEISYIHVG